jgi:hypothetical protein
MADFLDRIITRNLGVPAGMPPRSGSRYTDMHVPFPGAALSDPAQGSPLSGSESRDAATAIAARSEYDAPHRTDAPTPLSLDAQKHARLVDILPQSSGTIQPVPGQLHPITGQSPSPSQRTPASRAPDPDLQALHRLESDASARTDSASGSGNEPGTHASRVPDRPFGTERHGHIPIERSHIIVRPSEQEHADIGEAGNTSARITASIHSDHSSGPMYSSMNDTGRSGIQAQGQNRVSTSDAERDHEPQSIDGRREGETPAAGKPLQYPHNDRQRHDFDEVAPPGDGIRRDSILVPRRNAVSSGERSGYPRQEQDVPRTIKVTIGRVDVRANIESPSSPSTESPRRRTMSLEEYLKTRGEKRS